MAERPDLASSVGVVVVNWRQSELTMRACAELAAACSGSGTASLARRVVVVDCGSGDGSVERLEAGREEAGIDEVVALATNLGYCGGVNAGLRALGVLDGAPTAPSFVLLLNNDVRLGAGVVAGLAAVLARDPRLAGVMPTVTFPGGQRVWSQGGEVTAWRPNLTVLAGHGGTPAATVSGPFEVDYLPGAVALYRSGDLAAVGGLDESYFMYWEDADLGARLHARGRGLVWIPWFCAEHDAGSSSGGSRSPLRKFLMGLNTIRYMRTHGNASMWFGWFVFELLGSVAVLFGSVLGSSRRRRAARAKVAGVLAGLRGHVPGPHDVERFVESLPRS